MEDVCVFIIACIFSIFVFYNIIPKSNPYRFPNVTEIDKYTYVDNTGVCYKYVRKYL